MAESMAALKPIGVVREYGDLVDAMRERRQALGWSHLELDYRSGVQDGYTGKIENWRAGYGKKMGVVSLPLLLEALGLGLLVVEVPERTRLPKMDRQSLLDRDGRPVSELRLVESIPRVRTQPPKAARGPSCGRVTHTRPRRRASG